MDDTGSGLVVGSVFAGLVIVREIGRGGAGIVYLARDESLDRLVALKVLHRDSMEGDAAAAERFRNEALIAAKLEHPAIIPIYTTGVERGRQFIAMRYVPGRSLASYLNELAPLPTADAVRLLRPVAAALDYAADFDIVHRDVKPANIFVDESSTAPRTMLGDFGIARAYEGTRHTATGGWVGTPEYIAPEILKDDKPDARADQYSLACVLAECITGTSPFKRSNTAATVTAQVTEEPDLDNATGVGAATAEALRIGLEKNPHDRYGSCTEMLDAVEASLTRRDTATPNTIVRRRKRNKIQRRARIVATVAVTVIGLALGVAQITGFNLRTWLQGDSNSDRAAAADTPMTTDASGAEPQRADVVILGTELSSGDLWKYKPGVTAPKVIQAAFAENAETIGLNVEAIPLSDAGSCARDLTALAARMPTTAVIVLETPCPKQVVKRLGAVSVDSPPIYWLTDLWSDLDAAQAFLSHPPSTTYPERDPAIDTEFGDIDEERFFPLQLPTRSLFEAGVLANQLQRSSCALITIEGPYGERLFPGLVLAGMNADGSRASVEMVHLSRLEEVDTEYDLAGHDCVLTWWPSLGESKAESEAFKGIVDDDPQRIVITWGRLPDALSRWSQAKANVFQIEDWSWLPLEIPQERHTEVGQLMFRDWFDASVLSSRAPLLYVDDMVAHQSATGEIGSIPADQWLAPVDYTESTVTEYTTSTGVTPTPWGFSSGYRVLVEHEGHEYRLVGGARDPDWPARLVEGTK